MTDELVLKKLKTLHSRLHTDYSSLVNMYQDCSKEIVKANILDAMDSIYDARVKVSQAIHHQSNKNTTLLDDLKTKEWG